MTADRPSPRELAAALHLRRCTEALALELPPRVWNDYSGRVFALLDALEAGRWVRVPDDSNLWALLATAAEDLTEHYGASTQVTRGLMALASELAPLSVPETTEEETTDG